MGSTPTPDSIEEGKKKQEQRKRYKRVYYGLIVAGIVGYAILLLAKSLYGRDLLAIAGVGVYWAGILAALAVWLLGPVEFRDELDMEMERKASSLTLGVAGTLLIVGAPGMGTLQEVGVYTAPSWFWGMMWGYAILFGVLAVAGWYVKRQYS